MLREDSTKMAIPEPIRDDAVESVKNTNPTAASRVFS